MTSAGAIAAALRICSGSTLSACWPCAWRCTTPASPSYASVASGPKLPRPLDPNLDPQRESS